jgi:hypothetical protein
MAQRAVENAQGSARRDAAAPPVAAGVGYPWRVRESAAGAARLTIARDQVHHELLIAVLG